MKNQSILSKQTTLLLIIATSFATLFLPLSSLQAATLTDNMNASYVIGQPNFTAGETTTTQSGLNDVAGVAVDSSGDRLFVSDNRGNRVLVYDYSGGITNGMNASYVLGQPDFISKGSVFPDPPDPVAQGNLSGPSSLEYDSNNDYLYVVDGNNYRVLVYDVASITNGENAIYVLGQSNFTSNTATVTQSGLSSPTGLALSSDGNTLYVAEGSYGRIVVYDVSTIVNGENAINVLGALDFTSTVATTTQNDFSDLGDIYLDGNTLYVADSQSNRVMTFDVTTITNGENAVNVLGQSDFTSYASSTTAGTMYFPYDAYVDSTNNRLFVTDSSNFRVTVFDVASITDGEDAVNVLGQADLTSNIPGLPATQSNFGYPLVLAYDTTDDYLIVGDSLSVRIFDLSTPAPSSSNGWSYIHPPTCQATFSPSSITKGESTTLSWNTTWPTDKQNTYYTKVPGEGLFSHKVSSIQMTPQHSQSITMFSFNLWGASPCTAEITVLDQNGLEVVSERNSHLTTGVSNSPFVKAISNFFRSIFTR